jgi:pimeloyl-ACP methyl ester carboxylesterase
MVPSIFAAAHFRDCESRLRPKRRTPLEVSSHEQDRAARSDHRNGARLSGEAWVPADAPGIVLFAHGSGSSRFSPRNQYVAGELVRGGIGTLLFDLLTPGEEKRDAIDRSLRFDIALLTQRLVGATRWLVREDWARSLTVGYFGASTGAAAALAASVECDVKAVVSRGGRPDLAGAALPRVTAPTLLIVGSHDPVVVDLNRQALARLACEAKLAIVPGATHLFEEPGTLEQVAQLATDWFRRWLQEV